MKVVMRNARKMSSGKTISVKHNDRNFDSEDKNYDAERERYNSYMVLDSDGNFTEKSKNQTLEEYELSYYIDNYSDRQNRVNEKNIASGHKERCRSVSDVYQNPKTAPMETILQVGKHTEYGDAKYLSDNFLGTPEREKALDELEKFKKSVADYCDEHNKKYGDNIRIIDYSIHADESGYHAHVRSVFDYQNKEGMKELNQNKALEAQGVELPDPAKTKSKSNNRLMTYTQTEREHWTKTVERVNDVEIDRTPVKSNSKEHLKTNEYKNSALDEKINQKNEIIDRANEKMVELQNRISESKQTLKNIKTERDIHMIESRKASEELREITGEVKNKKNELSVANDALKLALGDSEEAQQMANMAISMMKLIMAFIEEAYKSAKKEVRDRIRKVQNQINRAERAEMRQNYYEEHLKPLYAEMSALKKEIEKAENKPFSRVTIPSSKLETLENSKKQLSIAMKKIEEQNKTIKLLNENRPDEYNIRKSVEKDFAPILDENRKLKEQVELKDIKIRSQETTIKKYQEKLGLEKVKEHAKVR